jgi:hypothetical protein
MAPTVTLLDLVSAISEFARSENELIAATVYMVNSGAVRLGGNFRGARFDLRSLGVTPRLATA